ncbi:MAG: sigma 54-interacting transcriptional regulator [Planctomycetota bacterium]
MSEEPKIHGGSMRKLAKRATDIVERMNARTVLILGPPGSGKEMLADYVAKEITGTPIPHKRNLAAMPETLAASDLFGHVKGAFTGAQEEREGLFGKLESNDTVLLDEIGDASTGVQPNLLRVLEYRDFVKVGGRETEVVPDDVTIFAATHRRNLRADLQDRFEVTFEVPALWDRLSDLPPLVAAFVDEYNERVDDEGDEFKRVTGHYFSCIALRLRLFQEEGEDQVESLSGGGNVRWLRHQVMQDCADIQSWKSRQDRIEQSPLFRISAVGPAIPDAGVNVVVHKDGTIWEKFEMPGGWSWGVELGEMGSSDLWVLFGTEMGDAMQTYARQMEDKLDNRDEEEQEEKTSEDYQVWPPQGREDELIRIPVEVSIGADEDALISRGIKTCNGICFTLDELYRWDDEGWRPLETDKGQELMAALVRGAGAHPAIRDWAMAYMAFLNRHVAIKGERLLPTYKEFTERAEEVYLERLVALCDGRDKQGEVSGLKSSKLGKLLKEHQLREKDRSQ